MADHEMLACPLCGTLTKDMQLSNETWEMTEGQKKWSIRNEPIFLCIGHEMLTCPCGIKLTWFQMKRLEETATEDKQCDRQKETRGRNQ